MNRVWYAPTEDSASSDTVHQVLMYGKLSEIQALKKKLGSLKVRKIFLRHPKKVYTTASLNFVKNFILNLPASFDDQQYLKNTPRVTR